MLFLFYRNEYRKWVKYKLPNLIASNIVLNFFLLKSCSFRHCLFSRQVGRKWNKEFHWLKIDLIVMGFSDVLSLPLLFGAFIQREYAQYTVLPTAMFIYVSYWILLYITFKRRDLSSLLGFPSQTDVEPWTHAPLRIVYMNAPIQYINQFLLFDVHVHIHAIWINVITIHSRDKIKPYLWAQHVANEH